MVHLKELPLRIRGCPDSHRLTYGLYYATARATSRSFTPSPGDAAYLLSRKDEELDLEDTLHLQSRAVSAQDLLREAEMKPSGKVLLLY